MLLRDERAEHLLALRDELLLRREKVDREDHAEYRVDEAVRDSGEVIEQHRHVIGQQSGRVLDKLLHLCVDSVGRDVEEFEQLFERVVDIVDIRAENRRGGQKLIDPFQRVVDVAVHLRREVVEADEQLRDDQKEGYCKYNQDYDIGKRQPKHAFEHPFAL